MKILIKWKIIVWPVAIIGFFAFLFYWNLRPAEPSDLTAKVVEIKSGESFNSIIGQLSDKNLIRSPVFFKFFSILTGTAWRLKPAIYELSPSLSGVEILNALVVGREQVEIIIPEGSSIYDIDAILSGKKIIPTGKFSEYALSKNLEGRLFPDTYKFFIGSIPEEIIPKFLSNFDLKAKPLLDKNKDYFEDNLILASLLEREVPDQSERRIVAGILKKRLKIGMPLQVDATICYAKSQIKGIPWSECYPLSSLDFKINSPYNTYLNHGLPKGPIGSPGISAVDAATNSADSPYWYYLSDPITKKTIFSRTLEEHNSNRFRYLKHN